MKTLVVYQSKYGSTKEYAKWVAEDLGADLRRVGEVGAEALNSYDVVIFGSYLHIGRIVDADFLERNWSTLRQKRVVLFTASAARPGSKELFSWYETSVGSDIRERIRYFPLDGRVTKLDFHDSLLIAFPKAVLALQGFFKGKKPTVNPYEPFDRVSRESILPLTAYVRHIAGLVDKNESLAEEVEKVIRNE